MLHSHLHSVVEGGILSSSAMTEAIGAIVDGATTPAQVGAFLTALRLRGETAEEIAGAALALRSRALRLPTDFPGAIDTCGTGGDGAGTLNISTLAALVAAGAGATVAKHGNRAISSRCGSADLLASLGVKVDPAPEQAARSLAQARFAFLFAPLYHPAMKAVAGVRREMGFRTLFNLLGPLCNPARVKRQLIGVFRPDLVPLMAGVLDRLGAERAMVVCSEDGLDEISVSAPTHVADLHPDGRIESSRLDPRDFGMSHPPGSGVGGCLAGGDPEENAARALAILSGEERGAARDAVLLNAAAALRVAGLAATFEEGIALAGQALEEGRALGVLNQVRELSQPSAGGAVS
jgi:anthranilate phosphoribosyltransferase